MAVVKGPLFSVDATDSFAKTLVFTHWKGRNTIRKLVKPKNPKAPLQVGMRAGFKFTSQAYKNIGATAQTNWKNLATKAKLMPLNIMQRQNQQNIRINKGIIKDPTLTSAGQEAAPTTLAATAGTKSVSLTWVDSAGANDFGTFVYMSINTGFTGTVSTLVAIVPHGVQTILIPKLVTGTPYYFRIAGSDYAGVLSAQTAQVTATPT